MRTKKVDCG